MIGKKALNEHEHHLHLVLRVLGVLAVRCLVPDVRPSRDLLLDQLAVYVVIRKSAVEGINC